MKKILMAIGFVMLTCISATAQKYALVDMEYILKNIPSYEMANQQLEQVSKRWQSEVEAKMAEVETLYKNYQAEMVFLSEPMKNKKEEEILAKEKEAQELRRKYFGPEGELFKKREALIAPIQDDIYNAVKTVAEEKGYMMVLDRASSQNIIFASPRIDISNDILVKLGYSK
ncbi:MAG: OmpH family outer membrane protein [Bacteroidales bacterium]